MEAPAQIYAFASATDRWFSRVALNRYTVADLQTLFINRLPYVILNSFIPLINGRWDDWQSPATKLCGHPCISAAHFVSTIGSETSVFKLKDLLSIAIKVHHLDICQQIIRGNSQSMEREAADRDGSLGYMEDLDSKTLSELARRIEESNSDWRYVADGLGFNNVRCRKMQNPLEMLQEWKKLNYKATLSRLFFETRSFEMEFMRSFVNAIPLEGISYHHCPPAGNHLGREFTLFDKAIIQKYSGGKVTEKDFEKAARALLDYSSESYLWRSCALTVSQVIGEIFNGNKLPWEQRFIDEVEDGIFEPTSAGGVTYSQIAYFGELENYGAQTHFPTWQIYTSQSDLHVLFKKHLAGVSKFPRNHTFKNFLLLYWQENGQELSLRDLTYKIINIFETTENDKKKISCHPIYIETFKEMYHNIKPWRSYDPLKEVPAPIEPKKATASDTPQAIAARTDLIVFHHLCKICFDRDVDTVVTPCGHFSFCGKCLKNLTRCPSCRIDIKDKLPVYR